MRGRTTRADGRTARRGGSVVAVLAALTLAAGTTAAVTLEDGPTAVPVAPAPSPAGPPVRAALLPAPTSAALTPTPSGLQVEVDAVLADPAVVGRLAVSIVDADTGRPLFERAAGVAVLPASTAKIATAVAALTALPPGQRLATRVVAGTVPGEVVLIGGGDTTLAGAAAGPAAKVENEDEAEAEARPAYPTVARLTDLAAQVRTALGASAVTRVLVDESLYSGSRLGPGWKPGYVMQGSVAPVVSLMVDGGRVRPDRSPRQDDPALAAGRQLAALLTSGAPVAVGRGTAAPAATQLGEVLSPPVAQLVERMLARSDNDLAEALARQVALTQGQPASFAGAATALEQVLAPLGLDPGAVVLADGSGLSRSYRIGPGDVTGLLARAASGDDPRLAPLLTGLPIAGFHGTLANRYRVGDAGAPAAGAIRAKTGTLDGVSALAGLVRTADGRLLAFDLTADGVPLGANRGAQAALDRLAAGLAACGCR
ncbi:MAG: D-alanyl-D-alanine carboxypeptidase/D-alanyl-D-alanine endopeptidase [Mycobacteriales bacterium]